MSRLLVKNLDTPDQTQTFRDRSRVQKLRLGDSSVARSILNPGWSWDEQIRPLVGGTSCPLHHREYVVSGQIRYLMDDGTDTVARAGDHLVIPPGHRAFVVGGEPCVLLDWE